MDAEAKARRVAAEVVTEYGVPVSYDAAVAMLAYAYARGSRDGYAEAAASAELAFEELRAALLEAVG